MSRSTILSTLILTAAMMLAPASPAAIAQQQQPVAPASVEAPQVVWTPTYFYDAFGSLWLAYVPTTPAQPAASAPAIAPTQAVAPAAPAQAIAPTQAVAPAARPTVGPRNREMGTGRNGHMHKPWLP